MTSLQFKCQQSPPKRTRGHQAKDIANQIDKFSRERPKEKLDDANNCIIAIQNANMAHLKEGTASEQQPKLISCQDDKLKKFLDIGQG